ncbi:uncharacterized protein LOC136028620 isoform X2 [Artemia franciscana]|uniref:uncharacterized protein LOC136028620 isoform X2 n=1 Tax=Artemia franciscana TaxID=6661 RepID=UPI0032DBA4DF
MRQIAFAKGFKVSGTTLADILLRIAYFNNWYTDLASESIAMGRLKDVTWGEIKDFNLVIEDNHWNRTEMKHMLDTDALRIAMLRRPPIQFESMFNFFDLRGFYNVTSIEDFIDKLERNEITNNSRLLEDRITPRIIQNVKTLQSINNRMHNFCQTSLNTTSEYHDLDKRFGTFDWNHIDSNR